MNIYLIVNRATGRYYVGQHKGNNLKKYLHDKFTTAKRKLFGSSRLFDAMRNHPEEVFTIHALLSDIQTKAELDQREKDFIIFLKSRTPEYGYNVCRGGEGFTGPFTEIHRKKISDAMKRVGCSIPRKARIRGGRIGGSVKSEAKKQQSRINGRLGGRKLLKTKKINP